MTDRPRCRVFTREDLDQIPELQRLPQAVRDTIRAVSMVLPFRVNEYVIEELIDWSAVPGDPIYNLVFPQSGMLLPDHLSRVRELISSGAPEVEVNRAARDIQLTLNVHPAGQRELNVPWMDGGPVPGVQHKYRETALFFPAAGQSCHSYCTYCFRWAQFTRPDRFRFEAHQASTLVQYLHLHPEVSNVLITGGDPLVMSTEVLRQYVEPLLEPSLDRIRSIRFGTKSLSYWPYRFVSDPDADDLLRLFEEILATGRHVALMAHVSHPRELETAIAGEAIRRIRKTGAVIRTQSPVVRGVNDEVDVWAALWRTQVRLGLIPYYMFVARDTGAQQYFKIPLAEALEVYHGAIRQVSGLGRTARGPVMSATPGKVLVTGVSRIGREDVFVLEFLQARDPSWVGRPFFARFDPEAAWLDELRPAFGEPEFFFEARFREIERSLAAARRPQRMAPPTGTLPPPKPRNPNPARSRRLRQPK